MVTDNKLGVSMGKVPMVKILLPYILGILISHFSVKVFFHEMTSWLSLCNLVAGAVCLSSLPSQRKWMHMLHAGLVFLFWAALGYWNAAKTNPAVQPDHFFSMEFGQYVGEIIDEPTVRPQTVRFPVRIRMAGTSDSAVQVRGNIMVTVSRQDSSAVMLRYGDVIAFKNTVRVVAPPYNPHEFDYKAYLTNRNIWHQCYLASDQYRLVSRDAGTPLISASLHLRQMLIDKFDVYLRDSTAFQVAVALIFGYRSQIDAATMSAFANTGTIHVLSVSGLHVGLVFGFLTLLLGWMDRFRRGKLIRCAVILLSVWSYVVLTGMAPPILRAGIMISFFLLSTLLGRKQVPLNTLAASALFILLYAPKSLLDVGFQLSYAAMLGILLFFPLLRALYLPANRYASWVFEYAYVSIAAQLFTVPFVLYYFGQFPNYFLLANLFVALPSTAIMYLGLLLAICPLELLNIYLGGVLDFLLVFLLDGLTWIERLPYSVVQGIDWPPILVLCGFVFAAAAIVVINSRSKQALFMCVLMSLCVASVLGYQSVAKRRYSGVKLYNVRSAVALAYIDRGKVCLFSSYDSIGHPSLQYSVLPDLVRYTDPDKIEFVRIRGGQGQHTVIRVGDRRIGLLEDIWWPGITDTLDAVVWRKNNKASPDSVRKSLKKDGKIILDGSNSDRYLLDFGEKVGHDLPNIYRLKDNFAYVWDSGP